MATKIRYTNRVHRNYAGKVATVDDHVARAMIRRGEAELVSDPPKPKKKSVDGKFGLDRAFKSAPEKK